MLTEITAPLPLVTQLPPNIVPIDTQADLYNLGVALFSFLEVANAAEAVEKAEGRLAYLLPSRIFPVYYLIFPSVTVKPYVEKGVQ